MKKLFITFIIFSICIVFIPQRVYAARCATYNDVKSDIWYCEAITKLQKIGVLTKLSTFDPNRNLSRAEALKVLYEASGKKIPEYKRKFFDISGNPWFKKYFYAAYGNKIIKSENGKMKPNATVSKGEFLVLFMKILEIQPGSSSCTLKETSSIPTSTWVNEPSFKGYLCKAQEMKIATKAFDSHFINRATAMQILYNTLMKPI